VKEFFWGGRGERQGKTDLSSQGLRKVRGHVGQVKAGAVVGWFGLCIELLEASGSLSREDVDADVGIEGTASGSRSWRPGEKVIWADCEL
jgi:hypothetical protein